MIYLKTKNGASIVEVVIGAVIVGIILLIIFKGYTIIGHTREQDLYSRIIKIKSAVVMFYPKHNRMPGDGCLNNPVEGTSKICSTRYSAIDGKLSTDIEQKAFWTELIKNELIKERDAINPLNKQSFIVHTHVSKKNSQIIIYLETMAPMPTASLCRLDQKYDDGIAKKRYGREIFAVKGHEYTPDIDCSHLSSNSIGGFIVY